MHSRQKDCRPKRRNIDRAQFIGSRQYLLFPSEPLDRPVSFFFLKRKTTTIKQQQKKKTVTNTM